MSHKIVLVTSANVQNNTQDLTSLTMIPFPSSEDRFLTLSTLVLPQEIGPTSIKLEISGTQPRRTQYNSCYSTYLKSIFHTFIWHGNLWYILLSIPIVFFLQLYSNYLFICRYLFKDPFCCGTRLFLWIFCCWPKLLSWLNFCGQIVFSQTIWTWCIQGQLWVTTKHPCS